MFPRWTRETQTNSVIPIPHCIKLYNKEMGGVDLNDMLVEYHRSPTKARRWYMSVIGYFLDLALVNAWLLYRRHARLLKEDHELDEEMGLTEEDINGDGGKDRLMSSKQFRVCV